jgi:hypothetical protein
MNGAGNGLGMAVGSIMVSGLLTAQLPATPYPP